MGGRVGAGGGGHVAVVGVLYDFYFLDGAGRGRGWGGDWDRGLGWRDVEFLAAVVDGACRGAGGGDFEFGC